MPWKETCAMGERRAFIDAWLRREFSKTELCERFGISPANGRQMVGTVQAGGVRGTRGALSCPS